MKKLYKGSDNMCKDCNCKKGFLERKIKTIQTVDGERQIIELEDSVSFLPITTDGWHILGKQFRATVGMETLGLYGGYIDKGETKEEALYREIFEEMNISADSIKRIKEITKEKYGSKGICTERNSVYIVFLNKTLSELDIKSNDIGESVRPYNTNYEGLIKIYNENIVEGAKTHHAIGYVIDNGTGIYKEEELSLFRKHLNNKNKQLLDDIMENDFISKYDKLKLKCELMPKISDCLYGAESQEYLNNATSKLERRDSLNYIDLIDGINDTMFSYLLPEEEEEVYSLFKSLWDIKDEDSIEYKEAQTKYDNRLDEIIDKVIEEGLKSEYTGCVCDW